MPKKKMKLKTAIYNDDLKRLGWIIEDVIVTLDDSGNVVKVEKE